MLSHGSINMLHRLMGGDRTSSEKALAAPMLETRLVLVGSIEEEAVEAAVAAYEEVLGDRQGRRANRLLRRRRYEGVGFDEQGREVLHGRRCCWEHSQDVQRNMHRLVVGQSYLCPDCGSEYRLVPIAGEGGVIG